MAQRYRLTRIDASNGPQRDKESNSQLAHYDDRRQQPYIGHGMPGGWNGARRPYDPDKPDQARGAYYAQSQYAAEERTRTRHKSHLGWLWTLLGIVAVVLIIGGVVWMSGVSGSLHHLNQTAQQNANSLAHQSAQLTGIQAQLQQISQQLSQISQQISTFFGNVMQAISSGKL
jgi:hypothetical protein